MRTAWSTELAPGHPGLLHRETLSQKKSVAILVYSTAALGTVNSGRLRSDGPVWRVARVSPVPEGEQPEMSDRRLHMEMLIHRPYARAQRHGHSYQPPASSECHSLRKTEEDPSSSPWPPGPAISSEVTTTF